MSIVACSQSIQEAIVFMPVDSAKTVIYSDFLDLASESNVHWPEIQSLVSRGQIISTDLLLWTYGHTSIIFKATLYLLIIL